MDVSLVMFKADGSRKDFPLAGSRVVVGRSNNCDLRIPLSSVSRQHCALEIEGDELTVQDLGSSNGTILNDNRVQQSTLEPGDELVIGPVVFIVVIDGHPTEIEPVRTLVSRNQAIEPELPVADSGAPTTPDDEKGADVPVELDAGDSADPITALESLADDSDMSGELPMLADDDDEART